MHIFNISRETAVRTVNKNTYILVPMANFKSNTTVQYKHSKYININIT